MKIEKTGAEAIEFADGLDNTHGDADLFIDLWNRQEFALIRGHFPAFAGGPEATEEVQASTEAPATEEVQASTEAPADVAAEQNPQ